MQVECDFVFDMQDDVGVWLCCLDPSVVRQMVLFQLMHNFLVFLSQSQNDRVKFHVVCDNMLYPSSAQALFSVSLIRCCCCTMVVLIGTYGQSSAG